MVSRNKLNDLVRSNAADKHALDMLDNLQCAYDTYSDIQMEILKLKDELDAPAGTFGTLSELAENIKDDAEAMFIVYYESGNPEHISDAVCDAMVDTYMELCKHF